MHTNIIIYKHALNVQLGQVHKLNTTMFDIQKNILTLHSSPLFINYSNERISNPQYRESRIASHRRQKNIKYQVILNLKKKTLML